MVVLTEWFRCSNSLCGIEFGVPEDVKPICCPVCQIKIKDLDFIGLMKGYAKSQ
jgi:hypothetical protein